MQGGAAAAARPAHKGGRGPAGKPSEGRFRRPAAAGPGAAGAPCGPWPLLLPHLPKGADLPAGFCPSPGFPNGAGWHFRLLRAGKGCRTEGKRPPHVRAGKGRRVRPRRGRGEAAVRGRAQPAPYAGRRPAPCGALSPVNVPPPEMQHLPANLIELAAQQVAYLPDLPGLHRKAVQLLPDIPQAPADRRRRYPHLFRYSGDGHTLGVAQPGQLLLVRGQAAAAPQLQ